MRTLFLALVFLAELVAWASFGVIAWYLAGGGTAGWIAAALTVAAVVVAWGLLASPKASAPRWAAVLTKVLVFGGAIVGLVVIIGYVSWALLLAVLVVIGHVGVHLTGGSPSAADLGQRSSSPSRSTS